MTALNKTKILIVEDDTDIAELVEYNLEKEGYQALKTDNGRKALEIIKSQLPQLIILDLMLPEVDGFEICKTVKHDEKTRHIPIIMLTAKGEETDVIVGLRLGADDYVTKPFSPKVLMARVKAVLRRDTAKKKPGEIRQIGQLTIDMLKHQIFYKDASLELTNIEFNILEFLSRSPGRVYNRDQIMDNAWKDGKFVVDRAVDVHIRSLRKKLGKGGDLIETVRGVGYRFKDTI